MSRDERFETRDRHYGNGHRAGSIASFRVQRIWPVPEGTWRVLTPEDLAKALVQIRGWQLRRIKAEPSANDGRW